MAEKPKCLLTVDVEALDLRAPDHYVDTLIYGRLNGEEWGIGRMMDIADRHNVKMTFFLDFSEVELYGDEIIQAGKYIVSRGHDLQIHCHYDLLAEKVMKRFPHADKNYHTWYQDEEISNDILNYCVEQYGKCTSKPPLAFRGGEYRFGRPVLKKLKEKGFKIDSSYNFIRPRPLPVSMQFQYENGLLELPIGMIPNETHTHHDPLNFNFKPLYPTSSEDIAETLKKYEKLFRDFYQYYGGDAIATVLMHGWSFCFNPTRFQETGYIDRPNPCAAELFDRLLDQFCGKLDFLTVSEAAELGETYFRKKVDFDSAFDTYPFMDAENLKEVEAFVKEKAGSRKIVIWGAGLLAQQIRDVLDFGRRLDVPFYISRGRGVSATYCGKPVKAFEDAALSPKEHYVLVLVKPFFQEVRDALRENGFLEWEDFFDINKPIPPQGGESPMSKKMQPCPICGGDEFARFNSDSYRRCEKCGSVERNRTIPKLFSENLGTELLSKRILHISPTRPERIFFKQAGAKNVTTLDVRPQVKPDIVADICNMPQIESGSFDVVLACCVLNHVYDDEAALAEIHRVLRDQGLFIVWVMGSGGMKTTIDANPTEWYGQETMDAYRVGVYRHYGETDFNAQLKRHFSKVRSYEKFDAITRQSCRWYVCEK